MGAMDERWSIQGIDRVASIATLGPDRLLTCLQERYHAVVPIHLSAWHSKDTVPWVRIRECWRVVQGTTGMYPEVGGVLAPFAFSALIGTHHRWALFGGYVFAAVLMVGAAVLEAVWGVAAEGKSLEEISRPLSATA